MGHNAGGSGQVKRVESEVWVSIAEGKGDGVEHSDRCGFRGAPATARHEPSSYEGPAEADPSCKSSSRRGDEGLGLAHDLGRDALFYPREILGIGRLGAASDVCLLYLYFFV